MNDIEQKTPEQSFKELKERLNKLETENKQLLAQSAQPEAKTSQPSSIETRFDRLEKLVINATSQTSYAKNLDPFIKQFGLDNNDIVGIEKEINSEYGIDINSAITDGEKRAKFIQNYTKGSQFDGSIKKVNEFYTSKNKTGAVVKVETSAPVAAPREPVSVKADPGARAHDAILADFKAKQR